MTKSDRRFLLTAVLQVAALAVIVMLYFYLRGLEPARTGAPPPNASEETAPRNLEYRADFTRRHITLSASELEQQVRHIERVAALAQQPPREVERILAQSDALAVQRPPRVEGFFDEARIRRSATELALEPTVAREAWQLALRTFRPTTIEVRCDRVVCRARFRLEAGAFVDDVSAAPLSAALLVVLEPHLAFDGHEQHRGQDERGRFIDAYLWRDTVGARTLRRN